MNDPKGPPRIPDGTYDIGVGLGYYDPRTQEYFTYEGEKIQEVEHLDIKQVINKYRYQPAEVEDLTDDEGILPE